MIFLSEIFFDENSIDNCLRQAYKKIVNEGFDSYIVLALQNCDFRISDNSNVTRYLSVYI
jgi:hypothetical protein